MTEKEFSELLRKYVEGTASPEERDKVDRWYTFLMSQEESSNHDDRELQTQYWQGIRSKMASKHVRWPALAMAAVISLTVIALAFLVTPELKEEFRPAPLASSATSFVNDGSEDRLVTLDDGSRVLLYPGSALQFSDSFNISDRRVFLSGGGFFEVTHNPEKPFYVYANEIVTKVLGTSFSVEAFPDKDITVSVRTGSVSVHRKDQTESTSPHERIVLSPNQQAVYGRNSGKISTMLVREPQIVLPADEVREVIEFKGAPLSDIFTSLEKMYGVDIEFDRETFSGCTLTTSGSGQTLYETLDIICEAIGTTYKVEGVRVKIEGTSCN